MHILTYGLSADKLAGIETFLLNMNYFMSDNLIFDYIIEKNETIHQKRIEEKGGKIISISPKRKILQNIRDWDKVLREHKDNPEVLKKVYFNMYSLAWIVPMFLCKKHKYDVVVHGHNSNLHNCGLVLRFMHYLGRELLKYVKICRYTNSSLTSAFFFGKKKAELIYNAIDVERFSYNEDIRNRIREELRLNDKSVYGFVGRIAYEKNPLFLMDVFSEIQKKDAKAKFVVCGDGNMMEETSQLAKSRGLDVLFLGSKQNVQDYYQAMDVFVLPSRFEGLGLVLIEAQTSGLPCITSADVVPREAKVTELLEYVKLNDGASRWADICVNKKKQIDKSRMEYAEIVGKTSFNIHKEAIRLENMLSGELKK